MKAGASITGSVKFEPRRRLKSLLRWKRRARLKTTDGGLLEDESQPQREQEGGNRVSMRAKSAHRSEHPEVTAR
ncbi:hypothetical protein EYF80_034090 [Liparis tanakae]|uniref:Uncharacterized protein n=1 Tax=Liparis tanakae TaxID=230148 RepID=A0A4Z2GRI1_9TELE|nr:hypothetical protein EYF80_034090 [Liparis tanakae]